MRMKEGMIEKYIKDLNALYKEIRDYGEDLFEAESMVIFCFGIIYKHINLYGLVIKDEKNKHGDAVAFLDPNAEKQIAIEFELRSKNFITHKHDPNKCDLIICWKDNWKECPEHIDVLELDYLWEKAKIR
jgi:hypothetical protein